MTFKRETKYAVIKIDDATKYLGAQRVFQLDSILERIQEGRKRDGKKPANMYVVVNEDEPYAELVWKLIETKELRGFTQNELDSIASAIDTEVEKAL